MRYGQNVPFFCPYLLGNVNNPKFIFTINVELKAKPKSKIKIGGTLHLRGLLFKTSYRTI